MNQCPFHENRNYLFLVLLAVGIMLQGILLVCSEISRTRRLADCRSCWLIAEAAKNEPVTAIRRVVRLAPFKAADGNNKTRSILVPVTSQGKTTMRTFRIISGANNRLPAGLKLVCTKPAIIKSQPVQAQTLSSTTTEQLAAETHSDTASEDSDGPRYPRLELTCNKLMHPPRYLAVWKYYLFTTTY